MARSIKAEVFQSMAPLGGSSGLEVDDFYMATFRGGKVQKVINMMGGPPRRVRRVLDFDSKREIEKEEALARKRKELGSASDFVVHAAKKKERTLAQMLLEMRQPKSAGAVATVQRKKPSPKKKVKKAVPVEPVEEVIAIDEVVEEVEEVILQKKLAPMKRLKVVPVDPVEEVVPIDEVVEEVEEMILQEAIPVEDAVHLEEVAPVDDAVHLEEVVPVDDAVHVEDVVHVEASPPRKKRKRRSSSVLQTCSKLLDMEEDSQGDDLTLAEYLKKSVSVSTTGRASSDNAGIKVFQRRKVKFKAVRRRTSKLGDQQSSSILVCDDLCECEACGPPPPKIAETSHPEPCTGEFESLTLPDDPVRHCSPPMDEADDFQELTEEQFREQVPSKTAEVCPEKSRYDEYLGAPNDVPEVLDAAESRPEVSEEMARCSFNTESSSYQRENAATVVTPMELDLAVDRIESILDTLVTPDDLLLTHLTPSASKSSRKKKKRRRFSESFSEEVSEVEKQRQEEPTPPAALPGTVSEEVASVEGSGIVGEQISEQIAGHIPEQIPELLSQELVSAHEATDTPADCAVDVEMVALSSIVIAEECSVHDNNTVAEEDFRTPTKSPSCDEDSPEREEIVGGTSTSKALFSNLKDKRNRKSFSPTSQKAFLAALKPERTTPFMIKVMKSKLGERCSLFSYEIVDDKSVSPEEVIVFISDCPQEVVVDKSDHTEEVIAEKPNCSEEVVAEKSDCPEEVIAEKACCSEEMVDDTSDCPEEVIAEKASCSEEMVDDTSDCSEEVIAEKAGCSEEMVDYTSDCLEEQDPATFAQDLMQCDVEQTEFYASIDSQPPQTSEEAFISSVLLSAPEPPSDCNTAHIVPGSPEYKKDPFVSREGPDDICTPDHSGMRLLPCTEGSLHIDVECHPETYLSDPKTPNDKIAPASQQPKSILKSAGSETCRGICTCPRCVATSDQSKTARKFIRSQMVLADVVASKLLDELRNLRTLVEEASPSREGEGTSPSRSQTKGALESASKTEDWAKKEMLKMNRDSKRVCRLIDVGPRRTIFADDAGHRLCHVKLLPAKKTLSKECLLPTKSL